MKLRKWYCKYLSSVADTGKHPANGELQYPIHPRIPPTKPLNQKCHSQKIYQTRQIFSLLLCQLNVLVRSKLKPDSWLSQGVSSKVEKPWERVVLNEQALLGPEFCSKFSISGRNKAPEIKERNTYIFSPCK